tara:strand:+ start:1096 stop:1905 length:810 start_codon:yes stop_codon:yes gene_type:complete
MNEVDATSVRAEERHDSGAGDARAKAPAKVALTSFVVYRVNGRAGDPAATVDVLAGGEAARFTPEGKLQLLASSAPFHSDAFKGRAPKPGHGLLALYGHRDALEELQYWRARAREMKAEFAYCNFDVQVDRIIEVLVDRKRLRDNHEAKFLNLRRTMSGLQSEIFERFAGYVASEGGTNTAMTAVSHIATRPDLFDRFFEDDKDFKHLSVFVIPVADDSDVPGKMRQMAYVRPGAKVLNIVQGSDQVDVLLPAWVTDEKAAKKLRAQQG